MRGESGPADRGLGKGADSEGYVTLENGIRLYYEIRGVGEQTLIVPAACFLSKDIDPLIDGRQVVFFDSAGRGASDPVTDLSVVTWDAQVDAIEAVRRELGIGRLSLWGWSIGGGVACRYAMDYPDRLDRLLVSGFLPPRHTQPTSEEAERARARAAARVDQAAVERVEELKAEGLDRDDPAAFCRELKAVFRPFQMGRPEAAALSRNDPCQYPNEWGDHWREILRALWESSERERSGRIAAPTLVIHGSEEPFPLGSSRDWTWSFTDARLLVMDGVAHFPWLEAPDAFFSVVGDFLQGRWPEEGEVIAGAA